MKEEKNLQTVGIHLYSQRVWGILKKPHQCLSCGVWAPNHTLDLAYLIIVLPRCSYLMFTSQCIPAPILALLLEHIYCVLMENLSFSCSRASHAWFLYQVWFTWLAFSQYIATLLHHCPTKCVLWSPKSRSMICLCTLYPLKVIPPTAFGVSWHDKLKSDRIRLASGS